MKILLASPIAAAAIASLRGDHDVVTAFDHSQDFRELIADCECVVVRSGVTLSADMLDRARDLRLIVRAGSGLDNIALEQARAHSIRLVRVPGPSAQAVAELTFGLMLALSRKIVHADALIRTGHWPKRELGGYLLQGKVLGIVGAGRIGGRVGQLGAAWGMRAIGCIHEDADSSLQLAPGVERHDFDTVVSEADIVSVHTPLTEQTRGFIDAVVLGKMRAGAMLINTARGGVVDEAALRETLDSGHLAGAALDVHEREGEGVVPALASYPNVVMTPHIGGMALESQSIIGRRVIELIDAYIAGDLDAVVTSDEYVL